MNQPIRIPWSIADTLKGLKELNQINPLTCKTECSYNKWLVFAKINSTLFVNTPQEKNKYLSFHNILRNIPEIDINKNTIEVTQNIKNHINAINTFITQGCSTDFFNAVLNHFHEKNPDIYKKFLAPNLRLEAALFYQKPQKALFLAQYILDNKKDTKLQQVNKNIFLALKCNYPKVAYLLFKASNGLIKNNDLNYCSSIKPHERLQVLYNFISANIESEDLLIEIITSIFLQNSYLADVDNIPKLIYFLAENNIKVLNYCYNILFKLKNYKGKDQESYVLLKSDMQDKIKQISHNCNITNLQQELENLQKEYPYFFIPIIEKKYYELKLNIDLSNIEQDDKISYIKHIIKETKTIIKLKKSIK